MRKNNTLKINIGGLIAKIGPINNNLRDTDGYAKICLMWEIGDILIKEGVKRIHPIAWEIQNKSYITRDLLSYCYRIRKQWPSQVELEKLFSKVKSYAAFREALPLIENKKYMLQPKEIEKIIKWLNEENPKVLKTKLIYMKKDYIRISNDRRQRLKEVQHESKIFIIFHKYLLKLIQEQKSEAIAQIKKKIGDERLLKLSQMCMAIANDYYKGPSNINKKDLPAEFSQFVDSILPLSLAKKEKKARFKRLISSENVVVVGDILNSIRLGESSTNIKKRLKLNIR